MVVFARSAGAGSSLGCRERSDRNPRKAQTTHPPQRGGGICLPPTQSGPTPPCVTHPRRTGEFTRSDACVVRPHPCNEDCVVTTILPAARAREVAWGKGSAATGTLGKRKPPIRPSGAAERNGENHGRHLSQSPLSWLCWIGTGWNMTRNMFLTEPPCLARFRRPAGADGWVVMFRGFRSLRSLHPRLLPAPAPQAKTRAGPRRNSGQNYEKERRKTAG